MLDSLRRHATGWVAKVLFGILVLSFAIWGIGDIFRAPHGGASLAEVAGSDVTVREVSNEFDRRVEQMQEQYGANLDRRAAVSLGMLNQALDAAVARRLVDAHGRDLDLTMADETVAAAIRDNPSFKGVGGFDRERFELFLRGSGMSEADFVTAVRGDLVRNDLISSITGPLGVPATLTRKLVEHRMERRRGAALVVDSAGIEVEAPSDQTLTEFLAANAKTYEAPELRSVALLVLAPEDLVAEIEVSDADVRAAYDERIDLYRSPGQRRFEQLLAADEATIKRAADMVATGQDFTAVAAALKDAGVERSELGPLAKGDLPESLDQIGWQLADGAVSAPVQTPFGWHLVRPTEIVPEQTQPFEELKGEIAREVALERATNQLPDFATKLDDELAAGTTLDAAASKLGIDVLMLKSFDRSGHTATKERLAPDRLTADILTPIFAAAQGETSLLEQTQDGRYFMFRVDAVEPPHDRPLAEVRDAVSSAWRTAEQTKRAQARAVELRTQATSPAALRALADANADTRLIDVAPLLRSDDGQAQGLGEAAVQAMFATKSGEVAAGQFDVPGGTAIVAVEEILPATVDEQVLDATGKAVLSSIQAELLGAYEAALRHTYVVSVNQAALTQLMEQKAQ